MSSSGCSLLLLPLLLLLLTGAQGSQLLQDDASEIFEFDYEKILLFTIRAHSNRNAYNAFMSSKSDKIPDGFELPTQFKSGLLENLRQTVRSTGYSNIVVEMRKNDRVVSQVVFDVSKNRNSLTKTNWFTASRVVASHPFRLKGRRCNKFSIAGDASIRRRFFINFNYGGCSKDSGFMMVSDRKDPCPWARHAWSDSRGGPALLYSDRKGGRYQSGSGHSADRLLIYLSKDVPAPSRQEAYEFENGKQLLFTIKANSNRNAYAEYMRSRNDPIPDGNGLPAVYRSGLIDKLADRNKVSANKKIVVEMRKNNRVVSQVVFDISKNRNKLTKTNWFTKSRVVSSFPYNIKNERFNFFSIVGDKKISRHFFIHFNYGGCPNDRGFMMVSDKKDPCPFGRGGWSSRRGGPALIYSTDRYTTLQHGSVRYADRLLIYFSDGVQAIRSRPPVQYSSRFEFESGKLLLFTIKANIGRNAYNSFINPGKYPVPANKALPAVYRSAYLDQLSSAALTTRKSKIVVEMRKGRTVVSRVVFDISRHRGSITKTNWFTKSRVVSSFPYNIRNKRFNFFSIVGDNPHNRHFFINFHYHGCPNDRGFMMVSDKRDPCPWGRRGWSRGPALIYSTDRNRSYHHGGIGYASRLLIYMV